MPSSVSNDPFGPGQIARQFLTTRMFARCFERQLQLCPLALGLYFSAADPRLQFQELQVARWRVFRCLLRPSRSLNQTQSFCQHPDLILSEFESVLIDRERSVELFEQ